MMPMSASDLDQVLEIESATFASPWRREHFLFEILENRWAVNQVVRRGDQLLAYSCVWELFEELKINNVAVRQEMRRHGLGRWLLERIVETARGRGCTVARLEVRPSNAGALALYRGFGFREVGRRTGYYQQEGEDAILMQAEL